MENEYKVKLIIQDLRNRITETESKYRILLQKHETLIEEYNKLKDKYIKLVK